MLSVLRTARSSTQALRVVSRIACPLQRQYSQSEASTSTATTLHGEDGQDVVLRPQPDVRIDPEHGLWDFFRREQIPETGDVIYETVEPPEENILLSGKSSPRRAWSAAELRRKSFRDLHTLWYVVLRERNLIATQMDEARRMGIINIDALRTENKRMHCRKTMARIKYVINERRLAYEKAVELAQEQKKEHLEEMERRSSIRRRRALKRNEKAEAKVRGQQEAEEREDVSVAKAGPVNEGALQRAAGMAAAGLFDQKSVGSTTKEP